MKWRPISEAPRDGTVVLAWRFYPVAIRWTDDKEYPWEAVQIGSMVTPMWANGFQADDPNLTHFLPLPPPPQEE